MTKVVIKVEKITKKFGNFTAVNDINFGILENEFFSLLGPSGSGKTTVLRMISGFERPTLGNIYIYGELANNIPPYKRKTNLIFQNLALFPIMNVYKNIAFGLEMQGVTKRIIKDKVYNYLETINLLPVERYAGKSINMLSGGEKQRVAIARSLILEPAVLLLDEPLASLDLKLREQMKIELKMIQHRVKTTFIYVTHDQTEASAMSNRIGVMNKGKLLQLGTPEELYSKPNCEFVAKFIGNSNKMSGVVESIIDGTVRYRFGDSIFYARAQNDIKVGDTVNVYIRLEDISISGETDIVKYKNSVEALVQEIVFEGTATRIICAYGDNERFDVLLFAKKGKKDYKMKEKVRLGWKTEDAKAFRGNGVIKNGSS